MLARNRSNHGASDSFLTSPWVPDLPGDSWILSSGSQGEDSEWSACLLLPGHMAEAPGLQVGSLRGGCPFCRVSSGAGVVGECGGLGPSRKLSPLGSGDGAMGNPVRRGRNRSPASPPALCPSLGACAQAGPQI